MSIQKTVVNKIRELYGLKPSDDVNEILEEYYKAEDKGSASTQGGEPEAGDQEESESDGQKSKDKQSYDQGQGSSEQNTEQLGSKGESPESSEQLEQESPGKKSYDQGQEPGSSEQPGSEGGSPESYEESRDDSEQKSGGQQLTEGKSDEPGELQEGRGKSSEEQLETPQKKEPDPRIQELIDEIFEDGGNPDYESLRGPPPPAEYIENTDEEVKEWNCHTEEYTTSRVITESHDQCPTLVAPYKILSEYEHLVPGIRRELEKLRKKKKRIKKRQKTGSRLNTRRATEAVASVLGGSEAPEDIWDRKITDKRSYSIGILIDRSGSTGYDVTGRDGLYATRLGVEAATAYLLSEALSAIGDEFNIRTFFSYRRNTQYARIKEFDEQYSEQIVERLATMAPANGGNRDGAAIRKMTHELKNRDSKEKILFMISDGRPADRPEYDDIYGAEDTIKAIEEAESEGVSVVYLTIDPEEGIYNQISRAATVARAYDDPMQLPVEIANIYKELRASKRRRR